jgi:hypothetical protein
MADPGLVTELIEDPSPGRPIRFGVLRSRIPSRPELFPVFSVFLFFSFTWSLYRLFWYVPSWLEYLSIWKVLTISAYVAAFALFESLIMTGLLAAFSLFFPPSIFKKRFVLVGASLAGLVSLAAFLLQRKINLVYRLELWQLVLFPVLLLLCLALIVFLLALIYDRFPILARFVGRLADRFTIFAYFYIPLGLIGLMVVLWRNLLGAPG